MKGFSAGREELESSPGGRIAQHTCDDSEHRERWRRGVNKCFLSDWQTDSQREREEGRRWKGGR